MWDSRFGSGSNRARCVPFHLRSPPKWLGKCRLDCGPVTMLEATATLMPERCALGDQRDWTPTRSINSTEGSRTDRRFTCTARARAKRPAPEWLENFGKGSMKIGCESPSSGAVSAPGRRQGCHSKQSRRMTSRHFRFFSCDEKAMDARSRAGPPSNGYRAREL